MGFSRKKKLYPLSPFIRILFGVDPPGFSIKFTVTPSGIFRFFAPAPTPLPWKSTISVNFWCIPWNSNEFIQPPLSLMSSAGGYNFCSGKATLPSLNLNLDIYWYIFINFKSSWRCEIHVILFQRRNSISYFAQKKKRSQYLEGRKFRRILISRMIEMFFLRELYFADLWFS